MTPNTSTTRTSLDARIEAAEAKAMVRKQATAALPAQALCPECGLPAEAHSAENDA